MQYLKNDIIKLYQQGYTVSDVSRHLGIARQTVRQYLRAEGVSITQKPQKADYDWATIAPRAIQAYEGGKTLKDVSKAFGVPLVRLRDHLADAGVLRGVNAHKADIPDKDTLIRLYADERWAQSDIAKHFGVSNPTVKKWLVEYGFDIRNFTKTYAAGEDESFEQWLKTLPYTEEFAFVFVPLSSFASKSRMDLSENHQRHKENNIRLFTIFDHEWNTRRSQIKAYLTNALVPSEGIAGRKCVVETIDKHTAKRFCNDYHIQSEPRDVLHASGLFHDGVLVGVMVFGRHHRKSQDVVLNRLVFSTRVVGGASKLFKHARGHVQGDIITWSDNRWSDGNVYEKLGFVRGKDLPPEYFYVNPDTMDVRSKQSMTRKKTQARDGQTERDRCLELGYWRVWDCGKVQWTFYRTRN